MKRILLCLLATGAFFAFGMAASTLMAQGAQPATQPGANKPAIPVAVVDYEYLVLVHPQLYDVKNKLQNRIKLEEQKFVQEGQKFNDMRKKQQQAPVGSQEYTQLTTELRRMESEIQIDRENILNKLQMDQIYAMYGAYKDIKECVEAYATYHNILVVINNLDISKRLPQEQSLMATAMQAEFTPTVMWTHPGYDITMHIEGMINQKYANLPKVDFEEIKKQMFGGQRGNENAVPVNNSTNVATPGQQVRPY